MKSFLTALVTFFTVVHTQPISFTSFQGPYGALVRSIAMDSSGTIYLGSLYAGIHTSSDGGISWRHASAGLSEEVVYAIHTAKGDTIFAGTSMEKVFRSTDHGAQWTERSSVIPQGIYGVSYGGVNGFASGTNGTLYAGSGINGVFVSTDQAATWKRMGFSAGAQFISTNSIGYIFVVSQGKLYRSLGDSVSWVYKPTGVAGSISAMTVAPDNSVYIAVAGSLYRSSDHGEQWTKIYSGITSSSIRPITVTVTGKIMFASRNMIFSSTDNGVSWDQQQIHMYAGSTTFGLVDAGAQLAANTIGGVYRSSDGGGSWTLSNAGLNGLRAQKMVRSKQGTLFALMGSRELFVREAFAPEWSRIATDMLPSVFNDLLIGSDDILWAGTSRGILRSSNSGATWTAADTVGMNFPVTGIVEDTAAKTIVALTASNGVYQSTNNGASWTNISTSASLNFAGFIRISPSGTLFVGANQSLFRSTDGGMTWGNEFQTYNSNPADIAFSPAGNLYLLSGNALYRSTDDGVSFTNVTGFTIFGGIVITAVDDRKIITGTTGGVRKSTDGGITWKSYSAGLIHTAVNTLMLTDSNYLLIGTNTGTWRSNVPEMNYSFRPDSLNFGGVRIGTSRVETVMVRNYSYGAVSVTGVTTSDTSFAPLHSAFILPGKDSISIPVLFAPQERRQYHAVLVMATSAGPDTIAVAGRGTAPVISFSADTIHFPQVLSGLQQSTKRIVVTNIGDELLTVSRSVFSDTVFSATPDSFQLLPSQTLNQTLTFAPDAAGIYTASLRYESNALESADSVILQGTGILRAIPAILPTLLDFGKVQIDSQRSLPVTVGNTGNDTLRVRRLDTLGNGIVRNVKEFIVPPQTSYIDTVTVHPSTFGVVNTYSLYIILNDSIHRFVHVGFTGYALSQPHYSVRNIEAGIRPIGVQFDSVIIISNTGTDTLIIERKMTGNSLVPLNRIVPPGGSVADTLSILPLDFGPQTARYRYFTNAYDSPDTVTMRFFGKGEPTISFSSPTGFTIADVESSTSRSIPVTFFNAGKDTLKVFGSTLSNPRFTNALQPFFLPPFGSILSDSITFSPQSVGNDTCYIVYQTNTVSGSDTLMVIGKSVEAGHWVYNRSFFEHVLGNTVMAMNGNIIAGTIKGILVSPDAGKTWITASVDDTTTQITDFEVLPGGMILASSLIQGILRSSDNGLSWTRVQTPGNEKSIYALARTTDGTIFALQQSASPFVPKFIVSNDNGITWKAIVSQMWNPDIFVDLFASSYGPLFMTGLWEPSALLLRSTDAGFHWQGIDGQPGMKPVRIFRENGRGTIYASNSGGGVIASSDTGNTWKAIYNGGTVIDIWEARDSSLYTMIYGQTIRRSTDHGATWTSVPVKNTNVFKVPFMRHYNGSLWWGHEYGLFTSRGPIAGRNAMESVPSPVRTGVVLAGKSVSLVIPLFNNSSDTMIQIVRSVSHPQFAFTHQSKICAPNVSVSDTLVYLPLGESADTCIVEYSTSVGTTTVTIIGRGKQPMQAADAAQSPHTDALDQNFPNPFNPATTINFSTAKDGHVSLKIFNSIGQTVAQPVNGMLRAGRHSVVWRAEELPSGIYFYHIQSGGFAGTKRMVLLK